MHWSLNLIFLATAVLIAISGDIPAFARWLGHKESYRRPPARMRQL